MGSVSLSVWVIVLAGLLVCSVDCSRVEVKSERAAPFEASQCPAVAEARVIQSVRSVEVIVSLRGFLAHNTDVWLRVVQFPYEMRMEHVGGAVWRARLSDKILNRLAVGNRATIYDLSIFVQDDAGTIAINIDPIKIAVLP